jgi:uncharacterized membrane protein YobD (UPF0266 family)
MAMTAHGNQHKLMWVADEYRPHDYDTGWYAGLFLFGAILIIWALYTNNIITTILFALIVFVVYALSHHRPSKVLVEITDRGVSLNNVFYPYSNLAGFFILEQADQEAVLMIETESVLNRHLSVELEEEDPEEVREFLGLFLDEQTEYQENFLDFLSRKLKL